MKFSLYVTALLLGATCTFASEELTFDLHGVPHHETVENVGNLVILKDEADKFIVILDYDRNVMTIKNTTTLAEVCYFGKLSHTLFSRDNNEPVFVTGNSQQTYEEGTVLSVLQGNPISFKDLTNEQIVEEECCGVLSFELVQTENTPARSARGARGDTVIIIIVQGTEGRQK